MTAAIEHYAAVTCRRSGQTVGRGWGSMRSPLGEATIGGDHILIAEELSIEPQDHVVFWEQSHRKLKFEETGFRIVGDGTLLVCMRYDLPTSVSDYTALGTRKRWRNQVWPCKKAPWFAADQTAYSLSTLADEVADVGGLPGILTNIEAATANTAVCDKIVLFNLDAANGDPVLIEKLLVQ